LSLRADFSRRRCLITVGFLIFPASLSASATRPPARNVLRVGTQYALRRVAEAARTAQDGDVIEIDAGDYVDDVATWPQSDLTLRAIGGMARMISAGKSAEGKAIWVIKGNNVVVENIAFSGAHVPGRNGAGIRHEGGKLTVRGCLFEQNEMGLLTWNNPSAELLIEASEFRDNAVAQPYAERDPGHQIYVGHIRRFTLRGCYVHRGAVGHLVKSRARENRVHYNRLTDETEGRASYELEFPDGGIAYVLGNIIQQSAHSENEAIVSFGAEGYKWPQNELYLVSNTLVDDLPGGGRFLRVAPGADRVKTFNNLLLGEDRLDAAGSGHRAGNFNVRAIDLVAAKSFDYRLTTRAAPVGRAVNPGEANGTRLRPEYEYLHPMQLRPVRSGRLSPGALQSMAR